MSTTLSARLLRVVDALPLSPGVRVLEIGGAPGAAAGEVARRVALTGHVLVLDRSPTGIQRTRQNCQDQVEAGLLTTMCASVEEFTLPAGVEVFDIAFACRVGALDGSAHEPVRRRDPQHRRGAQTRRAPLYRHRQPAAKD